MINYSKIAHQIGAGLLPKSVRQEPLLAHFLAPLDGELAPQAKMLFPCGGAAPTNLARLIARACGQA